MHFLLDGPGIQTAGLFCWPYSHGLPPILATMEILLSSLGVPVTFHFFVGAPFVLPYCFGSSKHFDLLFSVHSYKYAPPPPFHLTTTSVTFGFTFFSKDFVSGSLIQAPFLHLILERPVFLRPVFAWWPVIAHPPSHPYLLFEPLSRWWSSWN